MRVSTVPDDVNNSPQLDVFFEGMHAFGVVYDQGPNAFREKSIFVERSMLGGNLNIQVQEREENNKKIREGQCQENTPERL